MLLGDSQWRDGMVVFLLRLGLPGCRKRPGWIRWRMDETSIRVQGAWRSVSCAVEKTGQPIDCLLTAPRDERAAKRFLTQALRRHGVPATITIDGSEANAAALRTYNQGHGTAIVIRQVTYRNNIIAQVHRAVKRVTRPMRGLKAFAADQGTLVGIELMHMMRKDQRAGEVAEGLTPAEQFYSLAA